MDLDGPDRLGNRRLRIPPSYEQNNDIPAKQDHSHQHFEGSENRALLLPGT